MDLQYFLEMVDVKHRHGSHLRAYHTVWKNCPSNQNFFYWLDHGEGKDVELPSCPREKLERDQVRYLSPGERRNYMVKVDDAGLFRWVKNDELVDTDNKRYKDSLHGVVHSDDEAPFFRGYTTSSTSSSSVSSPTRESSLSGPGGQNIEGETTEPVEVTETPKLSTEEDYELHKAVKKFSRIKPTAVHDHFAGSFSVKNNMWIFVSGLKYGNLHNKVLTIL